MKKSLILFLLVSHMSFGQESSFKIAKLQYNGGGDWYSNKTSLPNLIEFCNQNLKTNIAVDEEVVEVGSPLIFSYPFVHMTGHGNVVFKPEEVENLRKYLLSGGFLHIDDNYGMDKFIRSQLHLIFPGQELTELPFSHPIYHQKYDFNGLPKIHEHTGKRAQAFAIIVDGRIVCLYTHETDLSDGWEDQEVHSDPENKRQEALKMGANILMYAFMQ